MIPDRGFTKELKILDKDLEVVWDWGSEKWEIWKFPEGQPGYHVTTVQTTGRTYKELGADVLLNLQMNIQLGPENVIKYLEEHEEQLRRRRMEEFRAKIDAIARETFINIHCKIIQVPEKYKIEPTQTQKIVGVV